MFILYLMVFVVNLISALYCQSLVGKGRNLFLNGFMGYYGERSEYDVWIELNHLLFKRNNIFKTRNKGYLFI